MVVVTGDIMLDEFKIEPDKPYASAGQHLVAAATLAQEGGDLETAARLIEAAYAWFEERQRTELW